MDWDAAIVAVEKARIMDYRIKYWSEKESDPIEFLKHFRCTTEPIGGGTEFDEDGELVDWDAAIVAIEKARQNMLESLRGFANQHKDIYKFIETERTKT